MRQMLGDEHLDSVIVMNKLANTLSNQGKLDQAASMPQEVLDKT